MSHTDGVRLVRHPCHHFKVQGKRAATQPLRDQRLTCLPRPTLQLRSSAVTQPEASQSVCGVDPG